MSRDRQLITYMGNKRKLIDVIEHEVSTLETVLGGRMSVAEAFTGSGVVSRMLRDHASSLYVNDSAAYSEQISLCYLRPLASRSWAAVVALVDKATTYADAVEAGTAAAPRWVRDHWSCADPDNVRPDERLYYTPQNATRIDAYREFIERQCPAGLKPYLLAPLLHLASVHVNTSGHFAAFYRDAEGRGACGGKTGTDIRRITTPIVLVPPDLPPVDPAITVAVEVTRSPVRTWATTLPAVDLVYIDPPYNKHPYATYYFMLDVIAEWNLGCRPADTLRGQHADWVRSPFNSSRHARAAMTALVTGVRAKFILLSYNSKGIIREEEMRELLEGVGRVELRRLTHNTYNKLQGIAAYKRKGDAVRAEEHLWVVDCR